jgi:hypothetical protein
MEDTLLDNISEEELLRIAREELSRTPFTFAKTYAKTTPHEYVLQEKYPKLHAVIEALVKNYGYPERFFKRVFRYYNIDDKKYWVMGNICNRTDIGNVYG